MTLYQLLSVEVGKGLPMSPGTCEIGICAVLTGRYSPEVRTFGTLITSTKVFSLL